MRIVFEGFSAEWKDLESRGWLGNVAYPYKPHWKEAHNHRHIRKYPYFYIRNVMSAKIGRGHIYLSSDSLEDICSLNSSEELFIPQGMPDFEKVIQLVDTIAEKEAILRLDFLTDERNMRIKPPKQFLDQNDAVQYGKLWFTPDDVPELLKVITKLQEPERKRLIADMDLDPVIASQDIEQYFDNVVLLRA